MSDRLVVADLVRTAGGVLGDALLIRHDRVVAVGPAEELRRPDLREDRYPGGVIVPGLQDAHFHPIGYASVLHRLVLDAAPDLESLLAILRQEADRLSPGTPLVAHRLDDESLAEGRLPTRADLDPVLGTRPTLLFRSCGHVGVANTAALERAGIDPDTIDPPGGAFDRDARGRPTGVLRETALPLVAESIGTEGVTPEQFLRAMHALAGLGLTGMSAIVGVGSEPWCGGGDDISLLEAVSADLPLRLSVLVVARSTDQLQQASRRLTGIGPRLRFLGLKAFADGSLGGHTAALRHPYHDRPDRSGILRLDPALRDTARACLDLGGRVAIHAIGDLANATVLDVFEDLLAEGAMPAALRIEHASVLADQEVDRLAQTGVTASVQPSFLPSETSWLEKRLGTDRLPMAYRFRTLAEAGVPMAGGSDCPVEPPSPFRGMAAARDRAGIVPEEGLDPQQALALYTDGAARASGEPVPLEPGAPADFVVLDRDPVIATPEELRRTGVLSTWIDGSPVQRSGEENAWRHRPEPGSRPGPLPTP